jgi:hypothetical protein
MLHAPDRPKMEAAGDLRSSLHVDRPIVSAAAVPRVPSDRACWSSVGLPRFACASRNRGGLGYSSPGQCHTRPRLSPGVACWIGLSVSLAEMTSVNGRVGPQVVDALATSSHARLTGGRRMELSSSNDGLMWKCTCTSDQSCSANIS